MSDSRQPLFLDSMMPSLSVGVLSANMMNLADDIAKLENEQVKMLHFDIMDGNFVPVLSVGNAFVKSVKTKMLKDVHLLINNPEQAVPLYASAGADIITIHAESKGNVHRALQMIQEQTNVNDPSRKISAGLALNPGTAIARIEPYIDLVDIIFLVCINAGFPNQKFNHESIRRFKLLKYLVKESGRKILLGIDGGITKENFQEVKTLEPDIIVSGSAVFEKGLIRENLDQMKF